MKLANKVIESLPSKIKVGDLNKLEQDSLLQLLWDNDILGYFITNVKFSKGYVYVSKSDEQEAKRLIKSTKGF